MERISILPSSLNDQLSAGYLENPLVLEHLDVLYSSRQAFMKIKWSNELRHALKKQTRKTREFFDIRQEVYYKHNSDKKWTRPGKIIGQDRPLVFIRHGGCHVQGNCSRVQLANINTENETNSKHFSNQTNQLNLIPSDNKFELEHKNKQYNDCCDSDSDDEIIDNQNESSSCNNLLPPDNHKHNSLTPDCNTSTISVRQDNDKLNKPATSDYV